MQGFIFTYSNKVYSVPDSTHFFFFDNTVTAYKSLNLPAINKCSALSEFQELSAAILNANIM